MTNVWEGKLVRVRAIEPGDAATFNENSDDSEVQLSGGGSIHFPLSREAGRRWAEEQAAKVPEGDEASLAIETLAGELVGGINPHLTNLRNGTFRYGIGVFRPHWRKGYASEAIVLLLRHFFAERRYQKCNVSVYGFNDRSIQLHQSLGFVEEGRLRRMVFAHGAYHDELIYGLTAEEFRDRHGSG